MLSRRWRGKCFSHPPPTHPTPRPPDPTPPHRNGDVDFIAASFIRSGKHVRQIRDFVREEHEKFWGASHPEEVAARTRPPARIISKVENAEGVEVRGVGV